MVRRDSSHEIEQEGETMKENLFAAMVVFALCLSPAVAEDAPALGVTLNGDTFEVAVPANAYDDTSKLYLVWGAGDCGERISAWPRANRRAYNGALSAAAATYQFSAAGIPAGSMVRAIVTSDVRLIDGWVSIGQDQYVNTGIKGNAAYGVEFRYRRTGASGAWASVIGSHLDNFTVGQRDRDVNKFYLRYRTKEAGNPLFTIGDTSVPHTFKIFNNCFNPIHII